MQKLENATNRNNPIQFNDPFGDCPHCEKFGISLEYSVQKGDNLTKIEASKSPITADDIVKVNPSMVNKRGKVNAIKI